MSKQKMKYNAAEVRITRSVAGLFLFALIALSIWGIRKLHLITGWAIFVSAPLLIAGALILGLMLRRHKKAGVDFDHSVWGMDYWFYICLTAAVSHGMLLISLPVDWWVYTAPIAYVFTAAMYVLYVAAWDQGANFKFFGILSMIVGLGIMLNYQTYYNPKQNFVAFRFFEQKIAFDIGWILLVLAAVMIWYLGRKHKFSVWKQESVLALGALLWFVLQMKWGRGLIVSWIFVGILMAWFVLMRVLKQIRIIK